MIYEQFPELKYKYRQREFWCKGYYVDTVGKNEGRIAEYIKHQLAETENEVKALRIVAAKEQTGRKDMQAEIERLRGQHFRLHRRLHASMITEGKLSRSEKEKKALYSTISESLTPEAIINRKLPENLTAFCFKIMLPELQNEKKPYILLCDEGEKYMVETGDSAKGNARRVLNFISSFDKTREKIQSSVAEIWQRLQMLQHAMEHPDETNRIKLREREEELNRLKVMLQSDLDNEEEL